MSDFDELGLDLHFRRQPAGILQGLGRDVDPGDLRSQQRPRQRIRADVAQQVRQRFTSYIPHLGADQLVQQGSSSE